MQIGASKPMDEHGLMRQSNEAIAKD